MTDHERIGKAIELIVECGQIDGDHHKTWVLDQVLQILMDENEYKKLIEELEENYGYDYGIPP